MYSNMRRYLEIAGLILLYCAALPAQHAVDPSARYYRVIALVHWTGSGQAADAARPEYVPTIDDGTRNGIIAWSVQPTDDKSMAIVHMVAVNHHAFDSVLADTRPETLVFEIGKDSQATIEAALQKYKKGFTLDHFKVVAQ
jgi:hypothetical protein